jgi:putative ABC transport system permease protein
VQAPARIIGSDGELIGDPQQAPLFGMSYRDTVLSPWVLTEGSRPPEGSDELAIDKNSADTGDLSLGDRVRVEAQAGAREFTLVGIVRFGSADAPPGESVALFDLATAQDFLGQPGEVDAVMVAAEEGISEEEITARVQAVMPEGVETLTGAEITEDQQDAIQEGLSFFTTFLLVFAGVGLFVGAFSIYNTFQVIVTQRTREMAMLRAIGASRRQVLAAMLVEAFFVGLVAAIVGIFVGVGLATVLKALLAGLGIDIPSSGLVFKPRTAVASLLVGTVVTMFSAVFPSLRASRVPPIAAMRDVAVDRSAASRNRFLVGTVITIIGAVGLVGGVSAGEIKIVGLGVALVFIGVFVLGPLIARPLARVLGSPGARMSFPGHLARENASRNPKRTSRTAAALMIGATLVTAIAVLASSIKQTIHDAYGEQFTGDWVVDSGSFGFGGVSPTIAAQLNELPEVEAATGLRFGLTQLDGDAEALVSLDPETAPVLIDLQVSEGGLAALGTDGVLVGASRADDLGVAIGDSLAFTFLDGSTRDLRVVGTYDKDDAIYGTEFVVSHALAESTGVDQFDLQVFVKLADGVSIDEARPAIEGVVGAFPSAELQDRETFIDEQAAQVDSFVNLIYAMLGLAVIIAIGSISNTLSLSIHERTREIGLVRAVGATRPQTRWMVRWESWIVALLGTVLGIVIGILFGYAIVAGLDDEGVVFSVPVTSLAIVIVGAIAAGSLAAIRPARRAARLDILRAVSSE